jgi:hypothetical protein
MGTCGPGVALTRCLGRQRWYGNVTAGRLLNALRLHFQVSLFAEYRLRVVNTSHATATSWRGLTPAYELNCSVHCYDGAIEFALTAALARAPLSRTDAHPSHMHTCDKRRIWRAQSYTAHKLQLRQHWLPSPSSIKTLCNCGAADGRRSACCVDVGAGADATTAVQPAQCIRTCSARAPSTERADST